MGFWMVAGLMSALVGAAIGLSLLRPRGAGGAEPEDDLQACRDKLRKVEHDLERGTLTEDEAARARVEAARRILEADAAPGFMPALAVFVLAIAGALGLYFALGAPGYPDLPLETRIALIEAARADRPSQAEAEAGTASVAREDANPRRAETVAQLREEVARTPDDAEALGLLAFEEARLGNFAAASAAQNRLIDLLGAEANAGNYIDLAEIQFMAAGGYVSPETEMLLREVLSRAPGNGAALYYTGLMFAQQGRPDLAYPIWRDLLAMSEPGDLWIGPIRAQIEFVAALAGDPVSVADLVQPPDLDLPGPTAAEIEAAGALAPGDRDEILETMAAGLSERLANLGGPPEDWVQLIQAYLTLDRPGAARSVYDRALVVFAGSDAALAQIRAAGTGLEANE